MKISNWKGSYGSWRRKKYADEKTVARRTSLLGKKFGNWLKANMYVFSFKALQVADLWPHHCTAFPLLCRPSPHYIGVLVDALNKIDFQSGLDHRASSVSPLSSHFGYHSNIYGPSSRIWAGNQLWLELLSVIVNVIHRAFSELWAVCFIQRHVNMRSHPTVHSRMRPQWGLGTSSKLNQVLASLMWTFSCRCVCVAVSFADCLLRGSCPQTHLTVCRRSCLLSDLSDFLFRCASGRVTLKQVSCVWYLLRIFSWQFSSCRVCRLNCVLEGRKCGPIRSHLRLCALCVTSRTCALCGH